MGYVVELCVDSLPNPTGSVFLSQMALFATFSTDGTTPILSKGGPFQTAGQPFGVGLEIIPSGTCKTWTRTLDGGNEMRVPFPTEGVPRFLMFAAFYGFPGDFNINQAPCPTPIPTNAPSACALRIAYDLGYHF
jgi:hypothetical protein